MNIEEIIKQLLDSDISAYRIAKDTGVSQSIITRLRNGDRTIDQLTVGTAQKLIDYSKK
ncbi:hypothetical protein OXT66_05520 [Lentilactobacillus senioris]|uniref:hypothetical protein n=1 Tax=Lentilactobacillus senioris TaxID=931534 RepID=UPI002282496A|nr:hypothetical protein [Lentilactobacillus senioris]MCY9807009.1 hypothetical protein [Lentilactobacillus senioris]